MELFKTAKTVRLLSHHKTYLAADPDYGEESVRLVKGSRAGRNARWTVEQSPSKDSVYLRSSTNRYLAASDKRFLLGAVGRRVVLNPRPDPSAEWHPIRDGRRFKFQTRSGTFLRGNGVMKPYSGAVTHSKPHRTLTQEWVIWNLDVLELHDPPPGGLPTVSPAPNLREDTFRRSSAASLSVRDPDECSVFSHSSREEEDEEEMSLSESEPDSPVSSPVRRHSGLVPSRDNNQKGRTIIYYVMDDNGKVDEHEEGSFIFEGSSVEDLTLKLEELTGIDGVMLCIRDIINDRLLRLRLNLPPNRKSMAIIVVPSSSSAARRLEV